MKAAIKHTLVRSVEAAGRLLLKYFGKVRQVRQKEDQASVVCEADLASEALVARMVRRDFPDARIIGEESGCSGLGGELEMTWVVDPLDGTSNFVSGLPWFGAQAGVLVDNEVVCAAMYLPVEGTLYYAEKGKGTFRNGKRVSVTKARRLSQVLCAFGFDRTTGPNRRLTTHLLLRLSDAVRNIRATNSLFDFCYTLDGRLGGCVNLNCKIWDIVPAAIMLPEAGGLLTNLDGTPIDFGLGQRRVEHSYRVMGASRRLHGELRRVLRLPAAQIDGARV